MSAYEVTTRRIAPNGAWEEWVYSVDAADEASALSKLLRRRGTTVWLLEPDCRFGFRVAPTRLADRSLVCEEHPDLPWPHGDCAGPGMLREDVTES